MKRVRFYICAAAAAGVVLLSGLSAWTPAQAQTVSRDAQCVLFPPVWMLSVLAGGCPAEKAAKAKSGKKKSSKAAARSRNSKERTGISRARA
jgi:hypothetical protein